MEFQAFRHFEKAFSSEPSERFNELLAIKFALFRGAIDEEYVF